MTKYFPSVDPKNPRLAEKFMPLGYVNKDYVDQKVAGITPGTGGFPATGGTFTGPVLTDDVIEAGADPKTLIPKSYVDGQISALATDYSYLLPGSRLTLVRTAAVPQPGIPSTLRAGVYVDWDDAVRGLPTPTPARDGDGWTVPEAAGATPDASLAYQFEGDAIANSTVISAANVPEITAATLNSGCTGVVSTANPPTPATYNSGRSFRFVQAASSGGSGYADIQSGKSGIGALSSYSDEYWIRLDARPLASGGTPFARGYTNDTNDPLGQAYNLFMNAAGVIFASAKTAAVVPGLTTNGVWAYTAASWVRVRIAGDPDATTPWMRLVIDQGAGSAPLFDSGRGTTFASGNEVIKRQSIRFGWLSGSSAGGTGLQVIGKLGVPTANGGDLLAPSYVAP